MPTKHDAILKRRDVYEIDPRGIEVAKGWNPRTDFSGEEELRDSIIENGVVEPLTVRMDDGRIVLLDGERRLRATLRAIADGHDIKSVPAIIARRSISDPEAMILAILKNDGKPLTATEEAEAFRRLAAWGMAQKDIARRIGRSQSYVSGRLALIDAAPEVKAALAKKEIKIKAANRIVAKAGGSVERQREELRKTKESNGAGKSAIVQALQLALEGGVPGINKKNPDIMDALGGSAPKLYVEAAIGETKIGRGFARDNGQVTQTYMVDRRKVDAKGFAAASAQAGAPKIVAVDEFLALPRKRMVAYLAAMTGSADLDALADKIEKAKEAVSILSKKIGESETVISKTSESLARLDLPTGSLAEVQKEIYDRESELAVAKDQEAKEKAEAENKNREEELRKWRLEELERMKTEPPEIEGGPLSEGELQTLQNPKSEPIVPAQALLDAARAELAKDLDDYDVVTEIRAAAGRSIRAIIDAINEAACPTCHGGAALLIAKRELRKWEGR